MADNHQPLLTALEKAECDLSSIAALLTTVLESDIEKETAAYDAIEGLVYYASYASKEAKTVLGKTD